MTTANIKITDANTTPLRPVENPSTTSFSDIPLANAIVAESNSAAPNAHVTWGEPKTTNVMTAVNTKVTKGNMNS